MRSLLDVSLVLVCVAGAPVLAAQRTVLTIDAPTPAEPRYSQALSVVVHLTLEDGTPVVGSDPLVCSPACSVIVKVGPAGADDADFVTVNPQGFVTDTTGTATARVTFVDGRYAADSAFPASTDGVAYAITARFLGSGAGQVPTNPDCVADAPADADGDLCPSSSAIETALFSETAEIAPGAGLEGALGDEITLSAELEDPNGDAPLGGEPSQIDGVGALKLVGRTVTFFYDVDNDGNAEAAEVVGTSVTNEAGVAALLFRLDPDFIRAGEYEAGVHVEFGGDDRYGVARAAARVIVRPADVDVARTVIEVDPAELPADGFSKSTVTVRLVDVFNNPLNETNLSHDVVVTTDLGLLIDSVEQDPLSGAYTQLLQAQRKAGTATIGVTVDGVAAPATALIQITGAGACRCTSSGGADAGALAFLVALVTLWLRLRRR
jgi:hypothetical protein